MFEKQTQPSKTASAPQGTKQGEFIAKPWGHEIIWAHTDDYVGKILFVRAGESLSLQYHELKDETMFLESGEAKLEVGDDAQHLSAVSFAIGTSYHIPPRRLHRLTAITDCRIFEVSTPQLADVVRVQDRYGRT